MHSSIISVKTVGYSHEKRPIQLVSLTQNSSSVSQRKAIFVECGIHSSEWISPAFCLYLMNKLVETKKSKGPLNYFDFYLIPLVNPDGLNYSWKNLRLWRKNRRPHNCTGITPQKSYPDYLKECDIILYPHDGTDCYGIDLNRNFDSNFATNNKGENKTVIQIKFVLNSYFPDNSINSEVSHEGSDNIYSYTYHGTEPFSEPETKAVKLAIDYIIQDHGSEK